ncbi:MAG TPA: type II toxin-antitoxin system death-on-curing family toxin [Terriglobales bacterium]
MKTPHWLDPRALVLLHAEVLAEHGGLTGLRDQAAFESAMARPPNVYHYERGADIPRLAAAYAYGIIQNHSFNDGNKPLGFLAAVLFLELNRFELKCDQADAIQTFFSVAAGNLSEQNLTVWIRNNAIRRG